MTHFVTQTGAVVTCESPTCSCNTPATPAAVAANDEERWFDDVCDAVEVYLQKYVAHRDCPKSEEPWREVEMHQAKRDVIARFYVKGWGA